MALSLPTCLGIRIMSHLDLYRCLSEKVQVPLFSRSLVEEPTARDIRLLTEAIQELAQQLDDVRERLATHVHNQESS